MGEEEFIKFINKLTKKDFDKESYRILFLEKKYSADLLDKFIEYFSFLIAKKKK